MPGLEDEELFSLSEIVEGRRKQAFATKTNKIHTSHGSCARFAAHPDRTLPFTPPLVIQLGSIEMLALT